MSGTLSVGLTVFSGPHRTAAVTLALLSVPAVRSICSEVPIITQQFAVTGTGTDTADQFGISLDADEGLVIVGAPRAWPGSEFLPSTGSAYLLNAASGVQILELNPPDGQAKEAFGTSVAISGNRAVVGGPNRDGTADRQGAAYVFDVFSGNSLFSLDGLFPTANGQFGISVAADNGIGVVSAHREMVGGEVEHPLYVFDLNTGELLRRIVVDTLGDDPANYGASVAIDGDIAVVGSPTDEGLQFTDGAAYVLNVRTGEQLATLVPDALEADGFFGAGVSVQGNFVAVGAPDDFDEAQTAGGAVVLYDLTSGSQIARFTPTDTGPNDMFGESVDLGERFLLVGGQGDSIIPTGDATRTAYVFDLISRTQTASLFGEGVLDGDFFGTAVAQTQGYFVIGAPGSDLAGGDSGAVYGFFIPEPSTPILAGVVLTLLAVWTVVPMRQASCSCVARVAAQPHAVMYSHNNR